MEEREKERTRERERQTKGKRENRKSAAYHLGLLVDRITGVNPSEKRGQGRSKLTTVRRTLCKHLGKVRKEIEARERERKTRKIRRRRRIRSSRIKGHL